MNPSFSRFSFALVGRSLRATAGVRTLQVRAVRAPAYTISITRTYASSAPETRKPRNEEIRHRMVQLVDSDTGKLHPLTPLRNIISSTDTSQFFVELVSETPSAIVRLVSKKDVYARAKAQKAKEKARGKPAETKELQLSWGVASGDLAHKLRKARQELEKGNRVDIAFAPKKGQAVLTPEDMQEKAGEVVRTVEDIAKEWKERTVDKGITILHLQKLA